MTQADQLSGDFRSFLHRFITNMLQQPEGWDEASEVPMRWIEGEAIDARTLRPLGIFSRTDRRASKQAFRSLTRLLQLMGLK
jgi:hypothetical protein